jgi:hypothetical protein
VKNGLRDRPRLAEVDHVSAGVHLRGKMDRRLVANLACGI